MWKNGNENKKNKNKNENSSKRFKNIDTFQFQGTLITKMFFFFNFVKTKKMEKQNKKCLMKTKKYKS